MFGAILRTCRKGCYMGERRLLMNVTVTRQGWEFRCLSATCREGFYYNKGDSIDERVLLLRPPLATFYLVWDLPGRTWFNIPIGFGLLQGEWTHGPDLALLISGMRNNNKTY
ncbi:hypothetical protein TNCV_1969051 [Trichonephila clavipes]|nr:hypothetical protein TNCV_1969051 [Trichonephila clavipes]